MVFPVSYPSDAAQRKRFPPKPHGLNLAERLVLFVRQGRQALKEIAQKLPTEASLAVRLLKDECFLSAKDAKGAKKCLTADNKIFLLSFALFCVLCVLGGQKALLRLMSFGRLEAARQLQYAAAMRLSLRSLTHSRCLRLMAVLAWLAMVSTAVLAAPTVAMPCCPPQALAHSDYAPPSAQHSHAANAATPAADSGMMQYGACSGHPDMGCGCHGLCGVALLVVPRLVQGSASSLSDYAVTSVLGTPTPPIAPPLRPPQA